jgi:hypothetical protein
LAIKATHLDEGGVHNKDHVPWSRTYAHHLKQAYRSIRHSHATRVYSTEDVVVVFLEPIFRTGSGRARLGQTCAMACLA